MQIMRDHRYLIRPRVQRIGVIRDKFRYILSCKLHSPTTLQTD